MKKSLVVATTCSIITIISFLLICNNFAKQQDSIEEKVDMITARQIADSDKPKQVYANIPVKKHAGNFKATFYCADARCIGEKKIIRTKTGNIPYPHKTIAVDSSVIPLHSIVYIKDMGYYMAEDTGADIKGNRVDIFVGSYEEAKKLGVKNVDIYILE